MRRFAKWLLILTACLCALLAALFLLRHQLLTPLVAKTLVRQLETQLGIVVEIGRVAGTYVTTFEMDGLRTTKPSEKGPLVSLDLDRVRVRYSLLELIAGLDPFLAKTSIEIEGLRVVAQPAPGAPPPAEAGGPLALPAAVPRVRVSDSSIAVRGEGYELALQGIALDARPGRGGATLVHLRVEGVGIDHPRVRPGSVPLEIDLTYTPEAVTIHRADVGGSRTVEESRFALGGLPESFGWRTRLLGFGGAAEIEGSLRGPKLEALWSIRSVDLSGFSTILVLPELPLAGVLDTSGRLKLEPNRLEETQAELALSLVKGAVRGVPLDRVDVAASVSEETIRIGRFDVRSGPNRLGLAEVAAPAPAVLGGDLPALTRALSARVSADLAEIPALLGALGVARPELPAPIPGHRLTLEGGLESGVVTLSRGELAVDTGKITLDRARFSFPEPDRPIDEATVEAALRLDVPALGALASVLALPPIEGSLRGEVNAAGTLGAPRGSARLDLRRFSFRGISVGDATVHAEGDANAVALRSLELRRGPDRVTAQGRFRIPERRVEKLAAAFSVRDLAAYEELLPPGLQLAGRPLRIGGRIEGSAEAEGTLDGLGARAGAEARGLALQGAKLGDLSLRAGVAPGKVSVESLELRNGRDRISAKGVYDLSGRIEDGTLRVSVADLGVYTKIFDPDAPVSGRVELGVDVAGPLAAPQGKLDLSAEGVKGFGVEVDSAVLEARGAGKTARVDRLEARSPLGSASLAGVLDLTRWDRAASFRFETLDLARAGVELHLARPGGVAFEPPNTVRFQDLALVGPVGAITVAGVVAPEGISDVAVEISGLTGKGWLEELAGDALSFRGLDAKATLKGALASPEATLTGRVSEISGAQAPVPLSTVFDLGYSGGRARVRRLDVTAEGVQAVSVRGEVPLRLGGEGLLGPGELSLTLDVSVPDLRTFRGLLPEGFDPEGALQSRTSLTGTWQDLRGRFELTGKALGLPAAIQMAPPGPFELKASADLEGTRVSLSDLRVSSPALSLEASGTWSGAPSVAALLQGQSAELSGELSGGAWLQVPDISWVAPMVGGLRRTAGRVDADLLVDGPIGEPRLQAVVRVADAELRPEAAVSSIRGLSLEAVADTQRVEIRSARGELGGAPFEISGTVEREGPTLDVSVRGQNLLLFRSEGVKVRADADLTVDGPLAALRFGGEIGITDGRFVKNIDPLGFLKGSSAPKTEGGFRLFSIPDPPLKDAVFHIRVTAKNPFEIRNNFVRGAVRPELLLSGTGEIPVLTGDVYVDSLRVPLPTGRLTFTSGVIRFLESDPDRPRLDIQGSSAMMGYQISASVEGPYDAPVVTLSSLPPLPEDELLLLLLTGQPPKTPMSRQAGQARSVNVAVYFGKGLLAKWFGDESAEADESLLDRFDVQIGRNVTRSGEETLEAQFRLADGVIRKGDALYITGERDVFDDFNAGLKLLFRFR